MQSTGSLIATLTPVRSEIDTYFHFFSLFQHRLGINDQFCAFEVLECMHIGGISDWVLGLVSNLTKLFPFGAKSAVNEFLIWFSMHCGQHDTHSWVHFSTDMGESRTLLLLLFYPQKTVKLRMQSVWIKKSIACLKFEWQHAALWYLHRHPKSIYLKCVFMFGADWTD